MMKIEPLKPISVFDAEGYAKFLRERSEEFLKIADSGYGLYWFAQCFYLFPIRGNIVHGIALQTFDVFGARIIHGSMVAVHIVHIKPDIAIDHPHGIVIDSRR